jgi:hypothetical protein
MSTIFLLSANRLQAAVKARLAANAIDRLVKFMGVQQPVAES